MGGENDFDIVELTNTLGSSPRGRGKPVSLTDRVCNLGLIPAWAGKTV